jgi:hypothetical protein
VPVPKWLLAGMGVLAVLLVGGLLGAAMADDPRPTKLRVADRASPEPAVPHLSAPPPVNVTIALAGPPVGPAGAAGPSGTSGPGGPAVRTMRVAPDAYAGLVPLLVAMPNQTFISPASSPWRSVAWASGPPPTSGASDVRSASAPIVLLVSTQPPASGPTHDGGDGSGAPTVWPGVSGPRGDGGDGSGAPTVSPGVSGPRDDGGDASGPPAAAGPIALQGLDGAEGFSVSANGNNIVIANNGSIVSVGDNTVLTANTGDASSSGVIGLDVAGSAVTSGNSDVSGSAAEPSPTQPGSPTGPQSSVSTVTTATPPAGGGPGTRSVAIAGYEDKSLDVAGNGNLLTSNDSNLFYQRTGHLNGNTGDTDTSGLNVVDATRSRVVSGNSQAPPPDPAPSDQPGVTSSPEAAAPAPAPGTAPTPAPVSSAGAPAPAPGAATASVASANGTATATGADSLAIGGRGVVDTGVQVHGDRNVTISDDGNVAVGGVGDVNAQVGDSNTSGAEVMHVADSEITTGNSASPTPEQANIQAAEDDPTSQPPTEP